MAIQQPNRVVKVSFRSRYPVNVTAVAEQFGGGGHKQAAGANFTGSVDEAVEQVRTAMIAMLAAR